MTIEKRRIAAATCGIAPLLGLLSAAAVAAAGGNGTAQITAEFAGAECTSVQVESTKDLSNVVLLFSDGSWEKFDGLDGHAGDFAGTGDNEGKTIASAYVKSGAMKDTSDELPGAVGVQFTSPCSEPGVE